MKKLIISNNLVAVVLEAIRKTGLTKGKEALLEDLHARTLNRWKKAFEEFSFLLEKEGFFSAGFYPRKPLDKSNWYSDRKTLLEEGLIFIISIGPVNYYGLHVPNLLIRLIKHLILILSAQQMREATEPLFTYIKEYLLAIDSSTLRALEEKMIDIKDVLQEASEATQNGRDYRKNLRAQKELNGFTFEIFFRNKCQELNEGRVRFSPVYVKEDGKRAKKWMEEWKKDDRDPRTEITRIVRLWIRMVPHLNAVENRFSTEVIDFRLAFAKRNLIETWLHEESLGKYSAPQVRQLQRMN